MSGQKHYSRLKSILLLTSVIILSQVITSCWKKPSLFPTKSPSTKQEVSTPSEKMPKTTQEVRKSSVRRNDKGVVVRSKNYLKKKSSVGERSGIFGQNLSVNGTNSRSLSSESHWYSPIITWFWTYWIVVVVIFLLCPSAGIWIIKRTRQGLNIALKQATTGIDEALKHFPKDTGDKLKSLLKENMDTKTRDIIKKIKEK